MNIGWSNCPPERGDRVVILDDSRFMGESGTVAQFDGENGLVDVALDDGGIAPYHSGEIHLLGRKQETRYV